MEHQGEKNQQHDDCILGTNQACPQSLPAHKETRAADNMDNGRMEISPVGRLIRVAGMDGLGDAGNSSGLLQS